MVHHLAHLHQRFKYFKYIYIFHIQVKLEAVNNDNNTRIKVFAPRNIPFSKKRPGKFNFLFERNHN